ncbi:hypothetical protein ABZ747_17990 [Kitasatospora cineracea]|uniref:hypothetical protein n=1 Tax=Kitasatospora cineracea TaxID=88074 RepID=UPI0033CC924B
MNPRTPDHDATDDDDLLFPTIGALPPLGPPAQDGHPDVIWHRPRRRLRDLAPASLQHLSTAALALAALAALAALVLLLVGLGQAALAAARWCADPQHLARPAAQLWHTVNDPLQRTLQRRGAGLPAGPGTLHTVWALAGALILMVALRRGASVGAQLGSLLFGTLTAAAVWDGTDGPGRPVAAGLTVLIWAVLAALALTGSWITTHTHTTIRNDIQPATAPDITVDVAPAQVPPPVVEVTVPEPRIETVLVVDADGEARRTSQPDQ